MIKGDLLVAIVKGDQSVVLTIEIGTISVRVMRKSIQALNLRDQGMINHLAITGDLDRETVAEVVRDQGMIERVIRVQEMIVEIALGQEEEIIAVKDVRETMITMNEETEIEITLLDVILEIVIRVDTLAIVVTLVTGIIIGIGVQILADIRDLDQEVTEDDDSGSSLFNSCIYLITAVLIFVLKCKLVFYIHWYG
jgi:hypothetical protein